MICGGRWEGGSGLEKKIKNKKMEYNRKLPSCWIWTKKCIYNKPTNASLINNNKIITGIENKSEILLPDNQNI